MIGRVEVLIRRLRRWLSRSELAARILHLPKSTGTAAAPGLIMVQVDGLAYRQLRIALNNGSMPFLRRLIDREDFRLHRHYSGIPSSTPAVQAELFYGIKGAVPAFSFRDGESGEIVRMFDPATAAGVEKKLESQGEPLLKGGSAYLDIFTGGADESHFCPASLGWGPALRAANPFAVGFLVLSNAYSFVRTALLLGLELVIAVVDCIRGLIDGRDLARELTFIPTRVAISVLLRELVTIGTKIDVARGLPIIHLNFLGYDEQAHRRGPTSKFAHWTLKGIDDSIARIWRAANNSARRDYDLWIYSDHGQEETLPYVKLHGQTIARAVAQVYGQVECAEYERVARAPRGIESLRARFLGGKKPQKLLRVYPSNEEQPEATQPVVAAMGPLGIVYFPQQPDTKERDVIARQLVDVAHVPLVLATDGEHKIRAWCQEGVFALPDEKEKILGDDHPFLDEVSQDLMDVCRHPDAGDLVLCGWRPGIKPYSFPLENGAHGGPGCEETSAFALLPPDTPLPALERKYLRPMHLREAATNLLGRARVRAPMRTKRTPNQTLRVMTYNVHSCIGMDGKLSPQRIARAIAQYDPDIVALQELDVGRQRTADVDQAHHIAQYLEMNHHFHPAMHIEEERYGDAILTHLPMRMVKAGPLPGLPERPTLEPRGALWVTIEALGQEVQVLNTHLGLSPKERLCQADALLSEAWLGDPYCRGPVILCGDFNALPVSPTCRRLRTRLADAQISLEGHRPRKTFFGRYPTARIDHVFVGRDVEVLGVEVANTALTRVASDHLPLIVEVRVEVESQSPTIPPPS